MPVRGALRPLLERLLRWRERHSRRLRPGLARRRSFLPPLSPFAAITGIVSSPCRLSCAFRPFLRGGTRVGASKKKGLVALVRSCAGRWAGRSHHTASRQQAQGCLLPTPLQNPHLPFLFHKFFFVLAAVSAWHGRPAMDSSIRFHRLFTEHTR